MKSVTAHWLGHGAAFEVVSETQDHDLRAIHRIIVDEPAPLGDDAGMMPTELLLASLGACAGISASVLLRRFKQEYDSLEVQVCGEQEDDWPLGFTSIEVKFCIGWTGPHDDALVSKALSLALTRSCPISATLRGTPDVTHHWTSATPTAVQERAPSAQGAHPGSRTL
jgi:putative redox protein